VGAAAHFGQPGAHLERGRHHARARRLRQRNRIALLIAVAVRHDDQVRALGNRLVQRERRVGVVGDEWVGKDDLARRRRQLIVDQPRYSTVMPESCAVGAAVGAAAGTERATSARPPTKATSATRISEDHDERRVM